MKINTPPLIRPCFTTSTVIRLLFNLHNGNTYRIVGWTEALVIFFRPLRTPSLKCVCMCWVCVCVVFPPCALFPSSIFIHFFLFLFFCLFLSITSSLPSSLQYLNMIMLFNLTVTGCRCEDTDSVLHKENKDKSQLEESANASLSLILFSSPLPPASLLRGNDTEIMTRGDVIE